jgi:hypothetical protein
LKRIDIYTVLLLTALVAIGISIGLLAVELQKYQWDIKAVSGGNPAAAATIRNMDVPQRG